METTIQKSRKIVPWFAAICLLALLFLSACSGEQEKSPETALLKGASTDFDEGGGKIFRSSDDTPRVYLTGDSGGRTLEVYYSRRQYPGSPPVIPHPVELDFSEKKTNCLSCHEKGGWTKVFARSAPVTPHPEMEACRQCHVRLHSEIPFVGSDWKSIDPPRLGRAQLPGGPPPIPHSLQLRGNCVACHTGPGSVVEIRVEHASRGNCRQCHVPLPLTELVRFSREL